MHGSPRRRRICRCHRHAVSSWSGRWGRSCGNDRRSGRGGCTRSCADDVDPARPQAQRDRPHRRRDDGEPVVRPLPRLAAGRRRPAGRAPYVDRRRRHRTRPTTSPSSRAAAHPDPDHSYEGGRDPATTAARCDGWLRSGQQRRVRDRLLHRGRPRRSTATPRRTGRTCDRYFAAIMAETYPNRFYQHAARDRPAAQQRHDLDDAADDLGPAAARRASRARYYYSDVPFIALWGTKYLDDRRTVRRSSSPTARPATLPGGVLRRPAVPRRGQRHARATTTRTPTSAPARPSSTRSTRRSRSGPQWERTRCSSSTTTSGAASSTTCRRRVAPDADPTAARVCAASGCPRLVISPARAARPRRATSVYDHTSILKMIEWRCGLAPLTAARRARPQPRRGARLHPPPNLHRAALGRADGRVAGLRAVRGGHARRGGRLRGLATRPRHRRPPRLPCLGRRRLLTAPSG